MHADMQWDTQMDNTPASLCAGRQLWRRGHCVGRGGGGWVQRAGRASHCGLSCHRLALSRVLGCSHSRACGTWSCTRRYISLTRSLLPDNSLCIGLF